MVPARGEKAFWIRLKYSGGWGLNFQKTKKHQPPHKARHQGSREVFLKRNSKDMLDNERFLKKKLMTAKHVQGKKKSAKRKHDLKLRNLRFAD